MGVLQLRNLRWKAEAGRQPTKKLLKEASTLAKPDSADHVVVAMAMRPNGVTQHEVVALFGHPHRNKLKKLLQDNKVNAFVLPDGTRARRIRLVKR
jgi:hypothetical protein